MRIEELRAAYDIEIEYVHFPLHTDTPPEGRSLLDLFGPDAGPRIEASQKRLMEIAAKEGLPMSPRDSTWNSRLAQELGAWAEEQGRGWEFHDAVFRACFAGGRNIGDPQVLLALVEGVGLDRGEAERALDERRYREKVDQDWERARAAGIRGVPTFIAGGQRLVGAQPYDPLATLVEAAGARKRGE